MQLSARRPRSGTDPRASQAVPRPFRHDLSADLVVGPARPYFFPRAHGRRRFLQPGKATGVLYGGCITLLVASLGTPYAPRTEGKLLFLEDRDVKPYQLDRLLRQMVLAGKFEGVTGIIFGEMLDCVAPGQKPGLLDEVILRVLDWFSG